MEPVTKTFHLPNNNSSFLQQVEIKVIEYKTADTNLKISDCNFESNNVLLHMKHGETNTLLDFKTAPDYMVLFLDENNFAEGGTYARNNATGYMIQTQCKKILLLLRCSLC